MRIFFIVLLTASFISHASAAEKIRIITRNLEPFSFEQDGQRVGFAMELWENVARSMNLESQIVVTDSAKHVIDAVWKHTADVGVSALSITAEREKIIDFSQPFYEAGLQILVSSNSGHLTNTIWSVAANVLNWKFLGSFVLLISAMLVVSHLVWMCEHKVNEVMWPRPYLHGMWESFWWTISTLLAGGADNKGPVGIGGRIIAIIWMLLSIVLVSLLTATFTTTLTINSLKGDINGPNDLPGKEVATVGGSTSQVWLDKLGAKVRTFPDIQACILALKKNEVKAVVFDAPILKYAMTKIGDEKLMLVSGLFDPSNYGFALQQNSPLREPINRALLALSENGVTAKLREKYFGKEE